MRYNINQIDFEIETLHSELLLEVLIPEQIGLLNIKNSPFAQGLYFSEPIKTICKDNNIEEGQFFDYFKIYIVSNSKIIITNDKTQDSPSTYFIDFEYLEMLQYCHLLHEIEMQRIIKVNNDKLIKYRIPFVVYDEFIVKINQKFKINNQLDNNFLYHIGTDQYGNSSFRKSNKFTIYKTCLPFKYFNHDNINNVFSFMQYNYISIWKSCIANKGLITRMGTINKIADQLIESISKINIQIENEVIKRNKEMIEKITSKYSHAGQQDNIN